MDYVQLSENYEEGKIMEILRKYLETSNFSVGGTDLYASRAKMEHLRAEGNLITVMITETSLNLELIVSIFN